MRDGEDFPAGRVDGNQSRGEQLLILRAVASAGVHFLINADLRANNRGGVTITLKKTDVFGGMVHRGRAHTWQKWCLWKARVA